MSGFDWDAANKGHIARHGVSTDEAEQAACSATLDLDSYEIGKELRFEDLGITLTGRILKLITTDREGLVRVVTAFDAAPTEKRLYLAAMVKR